MLGAVAVALVCGWIEASYMEHRVLFYDPLAYIHNDTVLRNRVVSEGRLAVIGSELLHGWNPLRTLPLLIVAPRLLGTEGAHLYTAAPALALFLVLLSWMVHRGTGSMIAAASAALFACAVPGFYDPRWGMGAYWLDLPGGFLVGAAACCFALSDRARNLRWLCAFGIIGGLAVWARQVTCVYLFLACGPLLAWAIFQNTRESATPFRDGSRALAAAGAPAVLLTLAFIVPRFDALFTYYVGAGYGQKTIPESLRFAYESLFQFTGFAFLFIGVACIGVGAWIRRQRGEPVWPGVATSLWLASSVFLFLGFTCQIGEARHATFPGISLLLVGFFWMWGPFPSPTGSMPLAAFGRFRLSAPAVFGLVIALSSVALIGSAVHTGRLKVGYYNETDTAARKFFRNLTRKIKDSPRDWIWGVYFDEAIPRLYVYGTWRNATPRIDETFTFVSHETYWNVHFAGVPAEEIAAIAVANVRDNVDVLLTFRDPKDASVEWPSEYGIYLNPISQLVAERVSQEAQDPTRWRKLFELETPMYGAIAAYRNLAREANPPPPHKTR